MKLRRPTDFLVLEALDERGRNVATNLAHHVEKTRDHINTRLPVLADYGLVRKVGPAEYSGLYEITRKGQVALLHRESYGDVEDFEALLERPDTNGTAPGETVMVRNEDGDED